MDLLTLGSVPAYPRPRCDFQGGGLAVGHAPDDGLMLVIKPTLADPRHMDDAFGRAADYLMEHDHSFRSTHTNDAVRLVLMGVPGAWLAQRGQRPIIFHEIADLAHVWHVRNGLPEGTDLVLLDHRAASLSDQHLVGVLAHELGHVCFRDENDRPTSKGTPGEIEADAYAAQWGFGTQLRSHLASEVAEGQLDRATELQLESRIAALDQALGTSA